MATIVMFPGKSLIPEWKRGWIGKKVSPYIYIYIYIYIYTYCYNQSFNAALAIVHRLTVVKTKSRLPLCCIPAYSAFGRNNLNNIIPSQSKPKNKENKGAPASKMQ